VLKETGRRKHRFKIRGLLADGRCSKAVLNFFSTMDVGRLVPAEEDVGSEASEWERRERRERKVEKSRGRGVRCRGEEPLFLPTPSLIASTEE